MTDFVDGLLAGLVMGGSLVGILVSDSIRRHKAAARAAIEKSERWQWELAVERATIKRERERARTELGR